MGWQLSISKPQRRCYVKPVASVLLVLLKSAVCAFLLKDEHARIHCIGKSWSACSNDPENYKLFTVTLAYICIRIRRKASRLLENCGLDLFAKQPTLTTAGANFFSFLNFVAFFFLGPTMLNCKQLCLNLKVITKAEKSGWLVRFCRP